MRFFGLPALLVTVLTGFIAPAFGAQTSPSPDSVKAFALEWFAHLQAGQRSPLSNAPLMINGTTRCHGCKRG
jgi:hypothetical protein